MSETGSFPSFNEPVFRVLLERPALRTGFLDEGGLFVWSDIS